MKIFMLPSKSSLGIGRVVDAYRRHLPAYGVDFVDNEKDADLVVCHAGEHAPTRQTDVLICHGLYPTATLDRGDAFFQMNAAVIQNAREAMIITVPSSWVAVPFQRDMHLTPRIVPHGVDLDEWTYPSHSNAMYVLWAKGHNPGVVDTELVNKLAERMGTTQFVTTFGRNAPNVRVTGVLPYNKMKPVIQAAGVYLATTRETFGIQTLEAMACGVPVVGYNTGATPDIVEHGVTGWLAKPGDLEGLVTGIEWALNNRKTVGMACRVAVERSFTWDIACEAVYDVLLEAMLVKDQPHKVSVIIPCYNYGKFVGKAIDSVLTQNYIGPMEIIVVDDGSNDNTAEAVTKYGKAVRYLHKQNAGVAAARNHGIAHASGDLIACLDADDWWEPSFLEKLVPPMLADRSLGLAYGHLRSVNSQGEHTSAWPPDFDFQEQSQRHNRVPSSCLFRKEAWKRAGGYRGKYTPAEDAELWLRIAAIGYQVKKVTGDVVYNYRLHSNSLSRKMQEPDWTEDKPYNKYPDLTPFAAPGGKPSHPFRDYDEPWVSVIIPVGPGHEHMVYRALDSLESQTVANWEVVVINDSGTTLAHPNTGLELRQAYPYIIEGNSKRSGVAVARNMGAKLARSGLLLWLDADDWLLPGCLAYMVQAYNENPCRYVYTDWRGYDGKKLSDHTSKEFSLDAISKEAIHPVTALVPRAWHHEIGGFDETLAGWEDWAYYLDLSYAGHCGERLGVPTLVYDYSSGLRRDDSLSKRSALIPAIRQRYNGRSAMGCSSCGKRSSGSRPAAFPVPARTPAVRGVVMATKSKPNEGESEMVLVQENSGNQGSHGVVGMFTRINYGRHKHGDMFPMHARDQAAQPQKYIRVAPPAVPVQEEPKPAKPVTDVASSTPVPAPQARVVNPAEEAALLARAQQPVADDEVEVDITIMPLTQIKQLDLTAEDAQAALELERNATKPRQSVIQYLEGLTK